MTEKHTVVNERGDHVKDPSWFSWRHKTRDEHDAARERYLSKHGPAARRARAANRLSARLEHVFGREVA